ncbi:MAG: tRNA uridine(34) 5-carboxymethylaminomethyl modification radical SAM/GNAT enzyme Elp3 [Candidatus Thermoplasmatota archaeon]|nr:tRNA uridine(34) 5-carboxymethylaminomethyl modification radical SAM/GNAT enzyme Elp3 [Candidatus Thermoplasmatota archaeon]
MESSLHSFMEEISKRLENGEISDKDDLQRAKAVLSRKYSIDSIPSDVEILNYGNFSDEIKSILRIKKTRTVSGVAVVAVMTSPERCPHGKCIYCPGGVENNSPQAYTGHEPAALRGRANGYDPYMQVLSRTRQLETIGHDTGKIDLIVMGGTFTARDYEYQRSFIKGCFDGMNRNVSSALAESILVNEDSERKCVGLTIETKPACFMDKEIDSALEFGATKVELGVQVLNERILRLNNRGHGVAEIIRSTQLARDAGFKIVYHLMPGMYGSGENDDIESFAKMITDDRFKPDMLKIYPTLVVKGTSLYKIWKEGKFTPLDSEGAMNLISRFLGMMPPWIRVQRMQRDIPVKFIEAGVKRSDLRNLAETDLKAKGIRTGEIRTREVGFSKSSSRNYDLRRLSYSASCGTEHYLTYENDKGELAGFLRLRVPSEDAHRKEMLDSTVVREIKVLGEVAPVGIHSERFWQHRGIGRLLLEEAENISFSEVGVSKMLVISGVGVRNYFRKLGYENLGPYMCVDRNMQ